MRISNLVLLLIIQLTMMLTAKSQCTNYQVFIEVDGACPSKTQVSWQLIGSDGTLWLSGGVPFNQTICLPDDCYTLNMLDTGGDGWDCVDWFIEDFTGDFDFDTNLSNGNYGTDTFELGNGDCAGGGQNGCPVGTNEFDIIVEEGNFPDDISWILSLGGATVISGGADYNETVCLAPGCYLFEMTDNGGDGWDDANFYIEDENGDLLFTGTLLSGLSGFEIITIGNLDCSGTTPGGGGGGGNPGAGCGSLPPTADCSSAPCVCDPYTFHISTTGAGTFADVPAAGTTSNPNFNGSPPWGDTDAGCLLAGELNSNWMMFTVGSTGTLAFSFGQNSNGGQFGFYDWAMWRYNGLTTCSEISGNVLAPVRCLWNATSTGGTGLASTIPAGGNAGNYGPPLNVVAGDQFIICLSNYSFANANVVLDFFGTATIQCVMVLPVDIVTFTANQYSNEVLVQWETSSENNCDYFTVERSSDGYTWEKIGNVQGQGSTQTAHQYSHVDHDPMMGTSYYRLLQFDLNGMFKPTDPVDVEFNKNRVQSFPNPADKQLQVYCSPFTEIKLYSSTGELVSSGSCGENSTNLIDTSNLSNGIYFIVIIENNQLKSEKILINHN